jgi:FRG domain
VETTRIKTIEELREVERRYGPNYLFRGQTKHYFDPTGAPDFPTSFERHGCIPPLMFKWTHYAKAIIRAFGDGPYDEINTEVVQAILQHYGWRSFYIDLTKSLSVASWFASHRYSDNRRVDMCENYEEDPVWLVHREATYTKVTEGNGHLYVVDTEILRRDHVGVHDLADIKVEDAQIRFHAQQACLAGNVRRLPPESIVAHFSVDSSVLVQKAQEAGLKSTVDLFPTRKTDIVLRALLDIPWQRIGRDKGFPIPMFVRGLDLPEYDHQFIKHLPPTTILFDEFWVSEERSKTQTSFQNIPFYRMPEAYYYANAPEVFVLPETTKLLKTHQGFAVELDTLIRPPEFPDIYVCEKGIHVERLDDDLVSVEALIVDHPANVWRNAGTSAGWIYRVEGNTWTRIQHLGQCPCNNDLRHELQFALLRVLDMALAEGRFELIDSLNFIHEELIRRDNAAPREADNA